MLLTTDADGRPRAAAVSVEWDGADAVVRAGRRSVANAGVRPLVSLLWPAAPGASHALLVDGDSDGVDADAGIVRFRPSGAILHVIERGACGPT
jgi:hypothetical protein